MPAFSYFFAGIYALIFLFFFGAVILSNDGQRNFFDLKGKFLNEWNKAPMDMLACLVFPLVMAVGHLLWPHLDSTKALYREMQREVQIQRATEGKITNKRYIGKVGICKDFPRLEGC
tara:strand:- start:23 stop:373 length:351 start_codon:yes stop_codon:yes gene_type:complete